jgi:two-component system cell cycle sensor histidine kinase/response regulator CckA
MHEMGQSSEGRSFQHQEWLQTIFQSSAIGIAICQFSGHISEANAEWNRMLGYSAGELTNVYIFDCELKRRKGEQELRVDFSARETLPEQRLLRQLLRGERESFAIDNCYRRKDGSELWGRLTVSLGRAFGRHPDFLIAVLADASERKQVEEHLREAEKLEAIGRMAGGIAHDFNNLLTGILLYCDLLSAGLAGEGLAQSALLGGVAGGSAQSVNGLKTLFQHVEEVRMAGEQGSALTNQLLSIARKQAAEPKPVAINEIVASTHNLLRRLIGEQIELVNNLAPDAGRVMADAVQLKQVLLNLVLNARDAMPQRGVITLSTGVSELPGESATAAAARPNGGRQRAVALVVKDNGQGMSTETQMHVFEPFFTTKPPGYGTGLGMATVRRIVNDAGGSIRIESEAGRGTSIEILLPSLTASIENICNVQAFPLQKPKLAVEKLKI